MPKIKVYNLNGEAADEMELSSDVFGVEPKQDLIHQVTLSYLANRRGPYAHTKTRGEVSGSGKKPWKQKGTGRARHGSIRSPLWVGGGITFGPRSERNYTVKINKKVKNKAFCMVLTDKFSNNEIVVVDKLELKEAKTKFLVQIAEKLLKNINKKMEDKGLLLTGVNKNVKLATRNLKDMKNVTDKNFGFLEIINSNYLIIEKEALKSLEKNLQNK
ncbi:MAG: 50S ribosomal protein L4 [Patescibacteria group bacterium]